MIWFGEVINFDRFGAYKTFTNKKVLSDWRPYIWPGHRKPMLKKKPKWL